LRLTTGRSLFFINRLTAGSIHILPSDNMPEFLLVPEGIIKIKGRGLFGNYTEVNDRILKWIDEYKMNPAEITYVIIALE
jgi:hypothetical protein